MADRVDGWVVGLFEVARAEGQLEAVEDDLFRFARALEGSDELRSVLTDEAVPASRRLGVVTDLLGNRASRLSAALVSAVVAAGLVRTTMFLGIAFTEALALIGFVVFILLGL